MFFFILITCLLDIVLILYGEVLSWSPMGVKGLRNRSFFIPWGWGFYLVPLLGYFEDPPSLAVNFCCPPLKSVSDDWRPSVSPPPQKKTHVISSTPSGDKMLPKHFSRNFIVVTWSLKNLGMPIFACALAIGKFLTTSEAYFGRWVTIHLLAIQGLHLIRSVVWIMIRSMTKEKKRCLIFI